MRDGDDVYHGAGFGPVLSLLVSGWGNLFENTYLAELSRDSTLFRNCSLELIT
jgi:hypothetical protein